MDSDAPSDAQGDAHRPHLGAWNYYFLAKLLLFWRGLSGLHPLENLAFAAVLALPLRARWLRRLRAVLAPPAALALLYYDSTLPPPRQLWTALGQIAGFSTSYLLELLARVVNPQLLALVVLGWVLTVFVARYLRIGVLVVAALALCQLVQRDRAVAVAAAPGQAGQAANTPEQALRAFYASEAGRAVTLAPPPAASVPFDLLFVHICSLSWADVKASGLERHRLWAGFDIVLKNFNSAASYSGPAAVRLSRATCGQGAHGALYAATPARCQLMPALRQAGFDTELVLNHDGHFDNFLGTLRANGMDAATMPLDGVAVAQRAFDDSAIHDDRATLARWSTRRGDNPRPRVAAYYNTISLHDGNRYPGGAPESTVAAYAKRLGLMLDELDDFMAQLERSGRRTVVVVIPEHGAAIVGDAGQMVGLREIPSPSITLVPVGIRVIGPDARRSGAPLQVATPTSYLAVSHIVAGMLANTPFGAQGFNAEALAAGLPSTAFVAENNDTVMMEQDGRYLLRPDAKQGWAPYAARRP